MRETPGLGVGRCLVGKPRVKMELNKNLKSPSHTDHPLSARESPVVSGHFAGTDKHFHHHRNPTGK